MKHTLEEKTAGGPSLAQRGKGARFVVVKTHASAKLPRPARRSFRRPGDPFLVSRVVRARLWLKQCPNPRIPRSSARVSRPRNASNPRITESLAPQSLNPSSRNRLDILEQLAYTPTARATVAGPRCGRPAAPATAAHRGARCPKQSAQKLAPLDTFALRARNEDWRAAASGPPRPSRCRCCR